VSPALIGRWKNEGMHFFQDARMVSEPMILALKGELTNRQAATALRIGEIHNRWRRLMRLRSTIKSANLEGGYSGGADLAEERMGPEQIAALEEAIVKARAAVDALLTEMPVHPREIHAAIIDLCVDNQPISSMLLPEVRTRLNQIARYLDRRFNRKQGTDRMAPRLLRPLHARVESEERPVRRARVVSLRTLELVVAKLRPDLDGDGMSMVRETALALDDRDKFRGQKERER
jgi:hypothetical protein